METWSEFKYWHYIFVAFVALAPFITSIWLINRLSDKAICAGLVSAIFLFVWIFAYPIAGIVLRTDFTSEGYKLAVVEKSNNSIVAHNLRYASLKPWLLPTQYRIVEYPVELRFSIPLQPVTKNPKVVPLGVSIAAKIPQDHIMGKVLENYILSQHMQELEELNFKRQVFDLLQHRLPQDVAEKINPFDPTSVNQFHKFLSQELDWRLPLHKVTYVEVYIH